MSSPSSSKSPSPSSDKKVVVKTPSTTDTTPSQIMSTIFQKSNIVLLLWFLAIYLVVYFLIGMFRRPTDAASHTIAVSRTFDFIILAGLTAILIMTFYLKTQSEKEQMVQSGFTKIINFVDTPVSLFAIALFIFTFYLCIYLVGIPMTYDTKPFSISIVETSAWILFVIGMIFVFFKSVLHINLKEYFNKLWNGIWNKETTDTDTEKKNKTPEPKKEVFNVGDNMYTYEDAQTVCSAYGARLATYDEIEKAYQDGAEWCNYGWSEGQMAFFPTQKDTWEKLQKNEKTKNSCGRPGVNGGFIDNPNVRFGINCYGIKPKPSDRELQILKETQASPDSALPKTEEDIIMEKKVQFWKENGDKILRLNSYNNKQWSAY